jgi:drug/metabolite transporter (DMT)-like permease
MGVDRPAIRLPSPTLEPRAVELMLLAGLLFAADIAVWHYSIHLTTVANAALLGNLTPISIALVGWCVFAERFRGAFLVGLVLSLAGSVILMGRHLAIGMQHLMGDALALVATLLATGYLLLAARLRRSASATRIVLWATTAAAVALLPVCLMAGDQLFPRTPAGWAIVVAVALCGQLGQSLIVHSLADLRTAFAAIVSQMQPIAAALFAWIVLGESLGSIQAIGAILVIAGIAVAKQSEDPRQSG